MELTKTNNRTNKQIKQIKQNDRKKIEEKKRTIMIFKRQVNI